MQGTVTATHEELAAYLRCLIYDLDILATCVQEMKRNPKGHLMDVCLNAGSVKLRAIHDFFFRPEACDSIKLWMFDCYEPKKPAKEPSLWDKGLTLQSIHTYVVHLDVQRHTGRDKNGKRIVQPGGRGVPRVIKTAIALMKQARTFVESLKAHPPFQGLNEHGKRWWAHFCRTLDQLT
jgi:hypothetical protein